MNNVNRTAALNICSAVLLQGVTFFTIPIFTRILGTTQYGMFSVFNSWILIVTCVMGLGVSNSLGTGRYQFKNTYYEFRSSILLFGSIISLGIGSLVIIFLEPISVFLGYEKYMVILLLSAAFGHYIIGFVQNACIYEKKAKLNFSISVTLSITSVGLSLIFITQFEDDIKYLGRVYGGAIPYIVTGIIMWFVLFLKKPAGLQKKYCCYAWMTGFPIVFHSLAQNILTQSDRVMMQYINILNSEIGIYSLFYNFTGVMGTILNALNITWCPFYYDDVNERNWKKLNIKCKNYIELYTVLTIGFLLLSREVSYILANKEFWTGINIIPILTLAVYFTFMYQFPVNFEFFFRKTRIIAIGTIGAAGLNILLNLILIPFGGIYGASAATALSYGVLFILHYWIATHMKEQSYHLQAKIFSLPLLCVVGTMVLFYLLADKWYIRWLLAFIIGIYELRTIYKRQTIF